MALTGCTPGNRTLKVTDAGKRDVKTGRRTLGRHGAGQGYYTAMCRCRIPPELEGQIENIG